MESEIKVYLLDGFNIIMGKDEKRVIKDAVKVIAMQGGYAIGALLGGSIETASLGMDMDKSKLNILRIEKPAKFVLDGYNQFISGETVQKSNIIQVPKHRLN